LERTTTEQVPAILFNMTAARPNSPALRIFVVEDHGDSLEVLRIYLESFGYVILSARSKAEALKEMPTANCDVLLSNIGLPDGNGWDLIQEVGKSRPAYAIATSNHAFVDDTMSVTSPLNANS
jgi:CheY-like chemotaxis protein